MYGSGYKSRKYELMDEEAWQGFTFNTLLRSFCGYNIEHNSHKKLRHFSASVHLGCGGAEYSGPFTLCEVRRAYHTQEEGDLFSLPSSFSSKTEN